MKKRTAIAATILGLAALAAVPILYAGGPGGFHDGPGMRMHGGGPGGFGGGMGFFGHLGRLQEKLDLSDAQADQIKAIFAEVHEQNETYREQLHGGFQEVAKTLLANPGDIAGAQAVLDRQAAAEKAMKQNMLTAASKALSVLTAEQRAELSTLMDEHTQRRSGRRNRQ